MRHVSPAGLQKHETIKQLPGCTCQAVVLLRLLLRRAPRRLPFCLLPCWLLLCRLILLRLPPCRLPCRLPGLLAVRLRPCWSICSGAGDRLVQLQQAQQLCAQQCGSRNLLHLTQLAQAMQAVDRCGRQPAVF